MRDPSEERSLPEVAARSIAVQIGSKRYIFSQV